jgi:hypothetical protein
MLTIQKVAVIFIHFLVGCGKSLNRYMTVKIAGGTPIAEWIICKIEKGEETLLLGEI